MNVIEIWLVKMSRGRCCSMWSALVGFLNQLLQELTL